MCQPQSIVNLNAILNRRWWFLAEMPTCIFLNRRRFMAMMGVHSELGECRIQMRFCLLLFLVSVVICLGGHDIRYNLITISHRILNFVSDNALHRFVEFVRLGVLIVTAG